MYIVEVKDLKGTKYYKAKTKYEAEKYRAKTPKLVKILTPHEFISLLTALPEDELYLM